MDKNVAYEFGGYRFEPSQARLVCGDQVIRLTTKASDTLLALVRQPDAVVSKDDIINAVWPGLAVEENNLNQQISALRKALSHNGHSVTIETVPRKGYRLVGPVRLIDPARATETSATSPRTSGVEPTPQTTNAAALLPHPSARQLPRRMRRAFLLYGLGVVALTVGGGFLWDWHQRREILAASQAALDRGEELLRQRNEAGATAELQTAIRLDPSNARAYSALAHALNRTSTAAASSAMRPAGQSLAVEAAQRAVALDPGCADCQGTLGLFLFYHDWQWSKGEWHLREAIRLDPNSEGIRPAYAMLLAATGRLTEAREQIDVGLERRPYEVGWHAIRTAILYLDRRYPEAIAAADQTLRIVNNHRDALEWRSKALFRAGRGPEAVHTLAQELFASHSRVLEQAVREGGTTGGLRKLLELTDDWRGRVEHSWRRAAWRALLNDHDGALDELEKACEMRRLNAIYFGVDPVYDALRDHPRYRNVLKKLGLDAALGARGVTRSPD